MTYKNPNEIVVLNLVAAIEKKKTLENRPTEYKKI